MLRLLCLATALPALALRTPSSRSPYDEEYQDYVEDFWEKNQFSQPLVSSSLVRERSANLSTGWCSRSRFIKPSPEDVVTGSKSCSDNHTLNSQEFEGSQCANNFGELIKTCDSPECRFYWMEIPASGSSTMRSTLLPYFDQGGSTLSLHAFRERDVEGLKAFALVRHPVTRFISGYDRVVTYLTQVPPSPGCLTGELKALMQLEEPARFERFVDLFVARGPRFVELYSCPESPCLLFSLLSQGWFLSLWPGRVGYVGHAESMEQALERLGGLLGVELQTPMRRIRKTGRRGGRAGGGPDLNGLLALGPSVRKLQAYFERDMEQFGYAPLPDLA